MNKEDLYGLKYYMIFCVMFVTFFIYSGLTGWKWINSTSKETNRPVGRTGHVYRYHK